MFSLIDISVQILATNLLQRWPLIFLGDPSTHFIDGLPCMLQGYIVYSVKNKLKPEYIGLPGEEIKKLKMSGVQVIFLT